MVLLNRQEQVRSRLTGFVKLLSDKYSGRIKSAIVFGSAAGGDYLPDKSDINLLLVTDVLPASLVLELRVFIHKSAPFLKSSPLLLSRDEITDSLDIFPLEFLAMKSQYQVLSGEDVLAKLPINQAALRLQCEREVKGKLINLRQACLDKNLDLKRLLRQSFRSFLPVFQGLLELKGSRRPVGKAALLEAVALAYGLDMALWQKLLGISLGHLKPGRVELQDLLEEYLNEVSKLAKTIDRL